MKSILVTGAAGFIGSFLCEELIENGFRVIGVDNLFRGELENLLNIVKNTHFTFKQIDLSELSSRDKINKILKDNVVEIVYHLAAVNGTQYFYDMPTFVLDQNTKMTINIMEAIEGTEVKNIIYTSSSEVYGEPQIIPTPETHPIILNVEADRDSYASSKAIGEFYTRLYTKKYGINFLVLRLFNTYGEKMVNTRYGQVIPEFIKKVLSGGKFTIIGSGKHTRSFCYIKDTIKIMVKLMEKEISNFLNLGNDEEISILELAKKIHYIEKKEFNPTFLPERPYDHKRRKPNISKLKGIFGEIKFTSLDEGLLRTIKYYRNLIN